MDRPTALEADALYKRCPPEQFEFETTDEVEELSEIIGQTRALEAVHFGVGIRRDGFNLYVMGPSGMGKHTVVRRYLEEKAGTGGTPPDWCYINNFDQPHKPKALQLPPGRGTKLRRGMEQLIEELSTAIPATFESQEYRTRVQAIEDEVKERQENAFNGLSEEAKSHRIKLFRTPAGFAFAPLKDGEVLGPDDFQKLPQDEQKHIEEVVANLQERLQSIIHQIPQWHKESREQLKAVNQEMTLAAVDRPFESLLAQYDDLPAVAEYISRVKQDVVENADDFLKGTGGEGPGGEQGAAPPTALHRYKVNLLVDHSNSQGAPVVYLDHPGYHNLVGRVEHIAQYGTLVTDFTLIKPGALHEASGGYLMIDARKLLTQPYAWEGLKRSLYANEIRIESLEKLLSLVSTVSLEPEPVPLDLKVVLLGDRMLYYLLHEYDPDFAELFKVEADFEEHIERSDTNHLVYARLIATLARKEELRPLHRDAVARVIEHSARLMEDAERLSIHMRSITDLMHEADYWASVNGHEAIAAADIQQAIDRQIRRASRVKERIQEEIERGTILIDTDGSNVGQANGLMVIRMGNHSFGQPSRITANVHLGEGHVVDIEREVELGGAIHSKGVMILSSFLAARYADKQPLSLSASLVFEQSYGMVDGDSASLAELCTLLSALGEVPIRQSLAMTGSVNQHGAAQPIGGVNEKIEGFFDICNTRGLTGDQGVVIPASNVKHLMLRHDVVDAASRGRFHIYPVSTVDEAIALLTGMPAGERDAQGNYPPDTINDRVQKRLEEMSRIRQEFGDKHKEGHDPEHDDG